MKHGTRHSYNRLGCRCRECTTAAVEYNKIWTHANPEKMRAYRRKSRVKHDYGITTAEHDELLARQQGCCAICGLPPNAASKNHNRLHIDHDHETGVVRGLLCNQCNRALGLMRESPERFQSAIDYLRRSSG